jgi:hypothetical protein
MDLDINNYSNEELIGIVKLNLEFSKDELNQAISTYQKIIKENKDYSIDYKQQLHEFFNKTKRRLSVLTNTFHNSNNFYDYKNDKPNSNTNLNTPFKSFSVSNNVDMLNDYDTNYTEKEHLLSKQDTGKIISPLTNINNNPLQYQRIPKDNINGYNQNKIVSSYVFNSQFRKNFLNTTPEDCEFQLPNSINNVISIALSGLQIKNTMFAFSSYKYTNQIYIEEDTSGGTIGGIVSIPDGNYDENSFPGVLEYCINSQIISENESEHRFKVLIDPNTLFLTISNDENNFTIKTIVDQNMNYRLNDLDAKNKISTSNIVNTMGYQIGFRNIEYTNEKSYTTESNFNNQAYRYIYFSLDDFNNSNLDRTYGILPSENILDDNILAIIPLSSETFDKNYIDSGNYINNKREYSIPINISKIRIKLLDYLGDLINNNYNDFTFTLEITRIRDNQKF